MCNSGRNGRADLNTCHYEYSHLYLAIEGKLAAVICIEDPLREEAADAVRELKEAGISKSGNDDRRQ